MAIDGEEVVVVLDDDGCGGSGAEKELVERVCEAGNIEVVTEDGGVYFGCCLF